MPDDWRQKIREYCDKYNIPLLYFAETMYEPKVIPMIRGKAFEFSALMVLQEKLPADVWTIDKPFMNAQAGFHDVDIRVLHKATNTVVRVECKLARKGSYKLFPDGHSEIKVKCMRSRTLGSTRVADLAPRLGVSQKVLSVHNDQYVQSDFDVVLSSIGNAFYETDNESGLFEFKPTEEGRSFLEGLGASDNENLKNFAFNKIYVAKTEDIAITSTSGVVCTRRNCRNPNNCGFVPNYPTIRFDPRTNRPNNGWIPIEECLGFFENFVNH